MPWSKGGGEYKIIFSTQEIVEKAGIGNTLICIIHNFSDMCNCYFIKSNSIPSSP